MLASSATSLDAVTARIAGLRDWLDSAALPLWWQTGAAKPDHGFYERIGQDGRPMASDKRRARVQPRQAYVYAAAGKAGWNGPWRQAVEHGLAWFEKVYRLENGLYGNLADANGKLVDPSFDLYNQAFALFAGAAAAGVLPERAEALRADAEALLAILQIDYSHPRGGFEADIPCREPLESNPHMHLFEAALAWEAATDGADPWTALADRIAGLAMQRFIDADSGALREFFDHGWNPMPDERGRIVEPGHQFEWAWLLARWGDLRGDDEALAKAKRLFEIGEAHGICARRKVAIMSLADDFSVLNATARLWPQTEWLKAAVRLAGLAEGAAREAYLASAAAALDALAPFLATPVKGLWYDKWPANGPIVDEPAPASTFYHIACAIYEAEERLAALAR